MASIETVKVVEGPSSSSKRQKESNDSVVSMQQ